jgi:hypothetical protein
MILDDEAINELARALAAQGWIGTSEALARSLALQSSAASVRAFTRDLVCTSKAYAVVSRLAGRFSKSEFYTTATGNALSMSSPDSDAEAACNIDFGSQTMIVRSRKNEDEDYFVERIALRN